MGQAAAGCVGAVGFDQKNKTPACSNKPGFLIHPITITNGESMYKYIEILKELPALRFFALWLIAFMIALLPIIHAVRWW